MRDRTIDRLVAFGFLLVLFAYGLMDLIVRPINWIANRLGIDSEVDF